MNEGFDERELETRMFCQMLHVVVSQYKYVDLMRETNCGSALAEWSCFVCGGDLFLLLVFCRRVCDPLPVSVQFGVDGELGARILRERADSHQRPARVFELLHQRQTGSLLKDEDEILVKKTGCEQVIRSFRNAALPFHSLLFAVVRHRHFGRRLGH